MCWKHSIVQSKKPKEAQLKCYNSGEDHRANYRGCFVAKKLQAIRNKASKPKNPSNQKCKPTAATRNEKLTTNPTTSNTQKYADTVKAHLSQPQKRPYPSKTKKEKAFPLKDN